MKTNFTFAAVAFVASLPALAFAQTNTTTTTPAIQNQIQLQRGSFQLVRGLEDPGFPQPRDLHPFRTGFSDRFPHYGRGDFDANFYFRAGHGPNDFNGTPESIRRDRPRLRHPTDGILDPELLEARGRDIRDRGIGVGQRAWGVGTGSGNQYAGIGAMNYGTTAGIGMLFSGLGDYWAGQGHYLEGVGVHNHATSLANINNEQAETLDLRNDEYGASVFFNKRLANIASRRQEDDARLAMVNRLSSEQLFRLSRERAPEGLRASEHDRLTGEIKWPAIFQTRRYAEIRNALDELFAKRQKLADRTGLGSDNYRAIREHALALEQQLQSEMEDLTPMEYVVAKNFLRNLEFEAQQPAVGGEPATDLTADLR